VKGGGTLEIGKVQGGDQSYNCAGGGRGINKKGKKRLRGGRVIVGLLNGR